MSVSRNASKMCEERGFSPEHFSSAQSRKSEILAFTTQATESKEITKNLAEICIILRGPLHSYTSTSCRLLPPDGRAVDTS